MRSSALCWVDGGGWERRARPKQSANGRPMTREIERAQQETYQRVRTREKSYKIRNLSSAELACAVECVSWAGLLDQKYIDLGGGRKMRDSEVAQSWYKNEGERQVAKGD